MCFVSFRGCDRVCGLVMDMLIKTEPPDDNEYCHGKAGACKF